jgi:TolB-like protein/Flp pilus assembly protein TadD/predicted Ser/Thr protein kinase
MIGQTLGHYRILEKIGAGGMGVVYRARDERLDRDVALKVLPAGALADDAARRRFRKEALVLAKLAHPNIAMIFDFDTQDGVDFLAMEYVAGQSLAQKLNAGGMQEKETLALGAQVAAALEEAHEQGVVHRDLNPRNILVTAKGQAKVLDFGLAKLLRPSGDAEATQTFAETEGVAGTLPYMAPEQLRGEALDGRTDIYALGCVFYEMAAGRRPFTEDSAPRLTDEILHQTAVSPRAVNARVSPQFEAIILKCLEKDGEDRYQSAKELSVDLRRLATPSTVAVAATGPRRARARWRQLAIGGGTGAIAVAALLIALVIALVIALNIGGVRDRLLGKVGAQHIRSLAVLPLENLSRDPEQEYFADGMTEQLITDLAQISALKVISRTSVMQYKGAHKPLPQIAHELGVDAVIEGSVQRAGGRVRISAQLIDARADQHLWARSYERDLRDVLALQEELARAIANEIRVALTPQEQTRLASNRSVNSEAYQLYLLGRFYANKRTVPDTYKSIQYFEQALHKDPNFALAYAGLADGYNLLGFSVYAVLPSAEAAEKARAATRRALELDDSVAEAHTALASTLWQYDWNWEEAGKEFQRAFELNPGHAPTYHLYAIYLYELGQLDEAMAAIRRAEQLDPVSPNIARAAGHLLAAQNQYDQAITELHRAIDLDPTHFNTHVGLGDLYVRMGRFPEAFAELEKADQMSGGNPPVRSHLARGYARGGRKREAERLLAELLPKAKPDYLAVAIARIYMGLGKKEDAIGWLEKGVDGHDNGVTDLGVGPDWEPLRSDPRFQALLRRIGLPR